MKLSGMNAVLTGGAKGMGAAITETLAREGADVFLAARDITALEEVADRVRRTGRRAGTCVCDVVEEPSVAEMVRNANAFLGGRIDILVNIVGITGPIETPVQDIDAADFSAVIETNIRGLFLPIKLIVPGMIAQRSGKIVNIAGAAGLRGYKNRAAYSASKWAIRGLTRTVALEVGQHNINCNTVCPGIVRSPRLEKLCHEKARARGWSYEQVYEEYLEDMALRRLTEPQDVANAVLFLASADARNITGQELVVDGGWDV
ncbi:SDR family NAD(P)-dependent oxidoreductase [Roseomonas sp. HF4]|uniref:SDR family NAD(P)-dependent oxidoreductase n=1 Tax=Roseomonas sp. HF4 TaxID=2562313 RepID=UPI0010C12975|nr:SDR family NAD(P)-dependent oxidoreductase [Roseomonas sp. HF4]